MKKYIFIFVALFLFFSARPLGALAAFTAVQSGVGGGEVAATTVAVTLTGVTAGNLVVVWVGSEDDGSTAATTTVSDGSSTLVATPLKDALDFSHHSGGFSYLLSANGGDRTYTVTYSDTRAYRRIIAWEFSYDGTASLDAEASNSGTSGTAYTSGSITTSNATDLVFGAEYNHSGGAKNTPLINGVAATAIVNDTGNLYASLWYKIQSSTFADGVAAINGPNTVWIGDIIAFKAVVTPSGGGSSAPAPTLLFSASPSSIPSGSSSTLNWSGTNTTACSLNGLSVGTSGTQSTGILYTDTSFSLLCAN